MARRKKGKTISGQFVYITHKMIDSKAWKSLSGNAILVYIEIMRKRNGSNDKDLSLTYYEMKGLLSTATVRKCFVELAEKGLIDFVRHGGLQKQCNIYAVSERWRKYGHPDFEGVRIDKWNYHGFAMSLKNGEGKK